jgi:hypothetical protein
MKKYKYILILVLTVLILPNIVNAGPAEDACNNKKNGDACSYTTSGARGAQAGRNTSGFCDRTNGDSNAANNPLTCRAGDAWKDCAVVGDACLGNTTTQGQRGTGTTTGTCAMRTTPASGRSAARTEMICDTSVKPPGTPGGRSPDGSTTAPNNEGAPDGSTTVPSGSTPDVTSPQTVSFVNPSRFNSIIELVAGVINALLGILGAITVAVLVLSGFKYMTSSNPGEVGAALDGIRNAIVGLMIVMGAFLITQYVISALAGSSTAPTTPTTNPSTTPTNPNTTPATPGTTIPTTPGTPTTP